VRIRRRKKPGNKAADVIRQTEREARAGKLEDAIAKVERERADKGKGKGKDGKS
jgi:hypothetical protein